MKGIAYAIICAAYLLLPNSEVTQWSELFKFIHGVVMITCIVGFWTCMLFEENKE